MENIDNYILDEQTLAEHYKEYGNTYGYEAKSKLVEYLKELKAYKEAEEQGLLLIKVFGIEYECMHERPVVCILNCAKCGLSDLVVKEFFIKPVEFDETKHYKTKEKAEQALEEMKIH